MRRGHLRRRAAFAGATTAVAVTVTAAAAGSAAAAAVATNSPCYLSDAPMLVAGQGFTPGAPVQVESHGVFAAPTADAAGSFQVATTAPTLPFITPGVRAYTLTASDGTNTASVPLRVTTFASAHTPRSPSRPQTVVRWRVSGLRPGARVFAHYVHHGRQQRRVFFGRMPKPCGVVSKRLAMVPFAHPAVGRWRIQIDTRKRYSARTKVKFVETGTVTRRIAG